MFSTSLSRRETTDNSAEQQEVWDMFCLLFSWLERKSRYLRFNKMLGEGTLLTGGSIHVSEAAVQQYEQTKTISQLIGLGYAEPEADGYTISHAEDIEQVIVKGVKKRYSSAWWLRNAVRKEKFKNLVNDSIGSGVRLCNIQPQNQSGLPAGSYIRLEQERVKTWKCVEEMAQLVSRGVAFVVQEGQSSVIYLSTDYLKCIDSPWTVVDSDLDGFRTLLGEPGNVRRMIVAMEGAAFQDGKLVINLDQESGKSIRLELLSLVDMGIAEVAPDGNVKVPPAVATWLLESVKNVSDRVSLSDILEDAIG